MNLSGETLRSSDLVFKLRYFIMSQDSEQSFFPVARSSVFRGLRCVNFTHLLIELVTTHAAHKRHALTSLESDGSLR